MPASLADRLALIAAVIATIAVRTAGGAATPPVRRVPVSDVFFSCPPGLTFEVNRDASRCRRGAGVRIVALAGCATAGGVSLAAKVDGDGLTDTCVASPPGGPAISVERACPSGFTRRVVAGEDRCEQPVPEEIRPPTVPVVR